MKKTFFISILIILILQVFSQDIKIGEWRSHLNYTEGIKSEEVGSRIYCATENGLFYFNKEDNSLVTLSKKDGFAETNISAMEYDKVNDVLMIAYYSTNIDIVKGNTVINVADLDRKYVAGKKTVNAIYFYNKYAYISSSFGIVVYDLEKHEVKESYENIGKTGVINDVTILGDSIYAATPEGMQSASLNSDNLMDPKYWKSVFTGNCQKIETFNNKLYLNIGNKIKEYGKSSFLIDTIQQVCRAMEVSNNRLLITYENYVYTFDNNNILTANYEPSVFSAMIDSEGNYWYTKKHYTLVKDDGEKLRFYTPNCPYSKLSWDIEIYDNTVWVASGGLSYTGNPLYSANGIYIFKNNSWTNKNFKTTDNFNKVVDILKIAIDPISKHAFLGSYGWGLAEYYNGDIQKIYDKSNSSLGGSQIGDTSFINIRGLCYDNENNLWVSNYGAINPVSVRYADGRWKSFSLGTSQNRKVGKIIIDDFGQKWITFPTTKGLIVFDENRQEIKYKKLDNSEGNGNLPAATVYDIAKDIDGKIWVGTNAGIAVFYDPSSVFTNYNFDAQQIWIDNGDESGYLLASESVTAIAVDGANNKWIGTRNGVWYVSEDGTEIIYNFNTDNSPLPVNYIRDIAINQNTGEVFFATDGGIVSLRNYATKGGETHEDVYAYPNPVKPDYNGLIAIKGLVRDANVKITDIAGNLVFETTAEGGQAIWNGKDFSGRKVHSGVYLIYSTNENGSETHITKLLIVR